MKKVTVILIIMFFLQCAIAKQKTVIAGPVEEKLLSFSSSGNLDGVKKLIESGAKINAVDKKDGNTALMLAAYNARYDIVETLLAADASVDIRNNSGNTALIFALWCPADKQDCSGSAKVVNVLIKAGADVNAKNNTNYTPLMAAVSQKNNASIVSSLLSAGADVTAKNKSLQTPFLFAVHFQDDLEVIQLLLKSGADINAIDSKDYTALMSTVVNNKIDFMNLLLGAGADPNYKDSKGRTALTHAAYEGNNKILHALIKAGADVNSRNNKGETVLMDLVGCDQNICSNSRVIFRTLIDAGIDINAKSKTGETALMNTASLGLLDLLEVLISAKADVNIKDNNGETALMMAGRCDTTFYHCKKTPAVIKALFKGGADRELKNNEGKTVSEIARKENPNLFLWLSNKVSIVMTSSTLDVRSRKYTNQHLIDGTELSWCEGAEDDGTGQEFTLILDKRRSVTALYIKNGIGVSSEEGVDREIWSKKNRVKSLQLSSGSKEVVLNLDDSPDLQIRTFSELTGKNIKATILSVYPGSRDNDTCISEIAITDVP